MLKNIRPGRLKGMTRDQIESSLEKLFECPVRFFDWTVYAYCVEQYSKTAHLLNDMHQLTKVGTVSVTSDRLGVAVKIVFNEVARAVISGKDTVETVKPEENTIL